MIRSVWNFVKRHRRKFLFTGAVIGGIWALTKYAKGKLKELQDSEAAACLEHARRQHHFDSNQRTCNTTVLSMIPTLRETLMKAIDTEVLTEQLKRRPVNKLEIWEELKVLSFMRTTCAIYLSSMLVVLLRVQLNIIGGYMYLDKAAGRNGMTEEPALVNSQVQQAYLENIQYLMGQGLTQLMTSVQEAVNRCVARISLKQNLSLSEIDGLLREIRAYIESPQKPNGFCDQCPLGRYMLPVVIQPNEACALSHEERMNIQLLQETKDVTETEDFQFVLRCSLDRGFSRLMDRIAEFYRPDLNSQGAKFVNPHDVQMPLAKVVPIVNGLIHTVCADAPNVFIQDLLLMSEVKDFAANIYEAFSQSPEKGD